MSTLKKIKIAVVLCWKNLTFYLSIINSITKLYIQLRKFKICANLKFCCGKQLTLIMINTC